MPEIYSVELKLGAKTYTLAATPRVGEVVSQRFNGISPAMEAVGRFDAQAMTTIIRAAQPKLSDEEAKGLPKALVAAGLAKVSVPLVKLLSSLLMGGRDPAAEPEEQTEGADPGEG